MSDKPVTDEQLAEWERLCSYTTIGPHVIAARNALRIAIAEIRRLRQEQQNALELEESLDKHIECNVWNSPTYRKQLAERDRELRHWFGCPACGERHDDDSICSPHEVRTTGQAWFHRALAEAKAREDELQKQLADYKAAAEVEAGLADEANEMVAKIDLENERLRAENAEMRNALGYSLNRVEEIMSIHGYLADGEWRKILRDAIPSCSDAHARRVAAAEKVVEAACKRGQAE